MRKRLSCCLVTGKRYREEGFEDETRHIHSFGSSAIRIIVRSKIGHALFVTGNNEVGEDGEDLETPGIACKRHPKARQYT